MAINSIGLDSSLYGAYNEPAEVAEDNTSLSNNDFMTLLLVELQYQDPTEPTDTEQILTQTSQLASLEATDKTNQALADLAASLSASNDFTAITAIGKMAELGSNAIALDEGDESTFEMHFAEDIAHGSIEILDVDGNVLRTMDLEADEAGTHQYTWDGENNLGEELDSGIYYVNASYTNAEGESNTTRVGIYPIESVRFESGSTLVKVGSNYVPLESIREVY